MGVGPVIVALLDAEKACPPEHGPAIRAAVVALSGDVEEAIEILSLGPVRYAERYAKPVTRTVTAAPLPPPLDPPGSRDLKGFTRSEGGSGSPSSLRNERVTETPGGRDDLLAFRAYAERYERATATLPGLGTNRATFERISSWIHRQADKERRAPSVVADELLDGFFRDPWASTRHYPPGALANQPGRFYRPKAGRGAASPAPPSAFEQHSMEEILEHVTGKKAQP